MSERIQLVGPMGLVSWVACVPAELSREEAEKEIRKEAGPTGIESQWQIPDHTEDEPNHIACSEMPGRTHWRVVC